MENPRLVQVKDSEGRGVLDLTLKQNLRELIERYQQDLLRA